MTLHSRRTSSVVSYFLHISLSRRSFSRMYLRSSHTGTNNTVVSTIVDIFPHHTLLVFLRRVELKDIQYRALNATREEWNYSSMASNNSDRPSPTYIGKRADCSPLDSFHYSCRSVVRFPLHNKDLRRRGDYSSQRERSIDVLRGQVPFCRGSRRVPS